MIKTTVFITATALTGAANPVPVLPASPTSPATAEQTFIPLPETQLVAQLAYLEVNHGPTGLSFSLGDTNAIFVDLEFAGDHHIRIGF